MRYGKAFRFVLIVCLLGVLLNVLVALTAALLIDTRNLPKESVSFKLHFEEHRRVSFGPKPGGPMLSLWVVSKRRGFASVEVFAEYQTHIGSMALDFDGSIKHPSTGLPGWVEPYIRVYDSNEIHCIGRGWPWVTLASDQRLEYKPQLLGGRNNPNNYIMVEAKTGWLLESMPWDSGRARVVPTRIVWKGFIANSLLFAALFLLPIGVRWLHRRRRGRCTACGYELRHRYEDGCPECGWNRPQSELEVCAQL